MRAKHDSKANVKANEKSSSKGSSAEQAMDRTTHVTKYIFRAPEPYKAASYILVVSMIFGLILNFDLNNFEQNFTTENIFDNTIMFGLLILGFPALLSGIISTPLVDLSGGTFYFRRSFLLSLFSMVILIVVLIFGRIIGVWYDLDLTHLLIFGYALIISIRHPVLMATSHHLHLQTLPSSINHTLLGFLFLWSVPGSPSKCSINELLLMLWFLAIFLGSTTLWLHIVKKPFERNFNVNGLLLMRHALSQFTTDKRNDEILEKEFFSKIGSVTSVRIGTISFRKKKESVTNKEQESHKTSLKSDHSKVETLLVIPSIHPGPFGTLGGSDLPNKISHYLKNTTKNLMVFHGPATHDYNPVATKECLKVATSIKKLVKNTHYNNYAGKFVRDRFIDISSKSSDSSTLNICAQRFGNGTVYIHTSSPESTDDIDYPTGEAIIKQAEIETSKRALFIDAHNCLKPGTGEVSFGSKKANNMIELVSEVNKDLKDTDEFNIKTSYSEDRTFKIYEGLGSMGIQVFLIKCIPINNDSKKWENNEKERSIINAYILLDGNNIIPGLREEILEKINDLVDEAEVFTTDNHIVNATMGGYNPVGLNIEPTIIANRVRKLVKNAKKKLVPTEVGMNSTIIKNIKILGQNTPLRLSATINATMAIMKTSFIACESMAITLCGLIAFLL